MSDNPSKGVEFLRETGLLKYVVPELIEGYQVGQNKHHIYEVYEHSIKSLQFGRKIILISMSDWPRFFTISESQELKKDRGLIQLFTIMK
jgi:hypothetical protein